MSRFITIIYSLLICCQSFAQSYTLSYDTTRVEEDWVNMLPGAPLDAMVNLTVDFTGSTERKTKWVRTNNFLPDGWYTNVCDFNACYDTAASYTNEFLISTALTGGDSTFTGPMIVGFFPNSVGYAVSSLHIFDKDNPSDAIDATFVATITGSNGIGKVKKVRDILLAPVPARNTLSVFYEATLHPEKMEVYDILGKLVVTVPVINDSALKTDVDVSALPKGLYILRVYAANSKVLTRQFSKE